MSSQISHLTLLGSAKPLPTNKEDAEVEAAVSTVEAKWLVGREEAAAVPVCFFWSITAGVVGISKTLEWSLAYLISMKTCNFSINQVKKKKE